MKLKEKLALEFTGDTWGMGYTLDEEKALAYIAGFEKAREMFVNIIINSDSTLPSFDQLGEEECDT
jgi:hypothetical protein